VIEGLIVLYVITTRLDTINSSLSVMVLEGEFRILKLLNSRSNPGQLASQT